MTYGLHDVKRTKLVFKKILVLYADQTNPNESMECFTENSNKYSKI